MISPVSDIWDKIRQQFDTSPYPRTPLDKSPKDDPNLLYIHNLVTPYYLNKQKVIDTKEKIILDAGCGTGYKSLVLAEANPGAKIVGVDISAESIKLARQRLEYHGFKNAEFYVLSIEELSKLDYQFDYINCDEVLYILPEPAINLQAMKAVLKPEGIIRSNLHSSMQRYAFFRAQKIFKMMGLMEANPGDLEINIVIETMQALKNDVYLKSRTWKSSYAEEEGQERVLMNYLLQGDTGYTISDMFTSLKAANLEFISMVNWRQWDLMDLFKEPNNLPAFLGISLPDISQEQRLRLFELIQPIHRLLDFWCSHPNQAQTFVPVSEWTDSDWRVAKVSLHPQLKTRNFQEDLVACITEFRIFSISNYLSLVEKFVGIDSSLALCLIPLLEQPQAMKFLVERWKKFRPLDPVTLESTDEEEAFDMVQQLLLKLESFGYVMLERQF